MTATALTSVTEQSAAFLDEVFSGASADFAVRFWDGSYWEGSSSAPAFTLVLNHPGSLRAMFLPPTDLNLGEAYVFGDFDIEGDIHSVYGLGDRLTGLADDPNSLAKIGVKLARMPQPPARRRDRGADVHGKKHSEQRDSEAIRYHYDVSNDFFSVWLDRAMVYSCAYFDGPECSLDTAQEAKLDILLKKLRLKPGERLLDIGCGWGGLVMEAARRGAYAAGITLSENQAEYARERIRAEGLQTHCTVEIADYREVPEDDAFDKLVSVGMFEHVGDEKLPEYFAKAYRLLKPRGVFLNHGIASNHGNWRKAAQRTPKRQSFSDRYVFPDGELVPVSRTLGHAEAAGFEVRDVESLREHYALTLRNWVARLEDGGEQARAATDEETYRVWRLFMSASAHGFETGSLNVYQTLLAKPEDGKAGLPLRREDWYAQA